MSRSRKQNVTEVAHYHIIPAVKKKQGRQDQNSADLLMQIKLIEIKPEIHFSDCNIEIHKISQIYYDKNTYNDTTEMNILFEGKKKNGLEEFKISLPNHLIWLVCYQQACTELNGSDVAFLVHFHQ